MRTRRSDNFSASIPENPLQEVINEILLEDPTMLSELSNFAEDMSKALESLPSTEARQRARGDWGSKLGTS